jgi:hypothetical protein
MRHGNPISSLLISELNNWIISSYLTVLDFWHVPVVE